MVDATRKIEGTQILRYELLGSIFFVLPGVELKEFQAGKSYRYFEGSNSSISNNSETG
jgi:hypothetical protein